MSDSDIDAAVLFVAKASWRKVALVVSQTSQHLGGDFAARDDAYELIIRRIHSLVAEGRLLYTGDLTQWRHSEVRLA